ncbi:MAG: hypothetical protein ABI740_06085 [Alphaproteobacteria bacterium]
MARWMLAASGAALCGEQAFAGAWLQQPGHHQQITDVSRERGDFGETWHTSAFSEYGFTKRWGAISRSIPRSAKTRITTTAHRSTPASSAPLILVRAAA